jgi:hypothetical protein
MWYTVASLRCVPQSMQGVHRVVQSLFLFDVCYPVSSRVSNVANDGEECSRRVEPAQIQDGLFQS